VGVYAPPYQRMTPRKKLSLFLVPVLASRLPREAFSAGAMSCSAANGPTCKSHRAAERSGEAGPACSEALKGPQRNICDCRDLSRMKREKNSLHLVDQKAVGGVGGGGKSLVSGRTYRKAGVKGRKEAHFLFRPQ